jgi:hypothetical protein
MEHAGAQRFIYLSFLGVRDGRSQLSFFGKHIVAPLVLRNVVTDHEIGIDAHSLAAKVRPNVAGQALERACSERRRVAVDPTLRTARLS